MKVMVVGLSVKDYVMWPLSGPFRQIWYRSDGPDITIAALDSDCEGWMCLPDLNLDFPARRVKVMSQGYEAGASTIWTADQSRRWVLAIVQPGILVGVGLCSPLSRYYYLLPALPSAW